MAVSGPPPLPDYLPSKQKYVVGEPVKKVAWNKINPQTIKKESLWANIDEKRCQNKDFFLSIKENFATKTVPSKTTWFTAKDQSIVFSLQRSTRPPIATRNPLLPQRTSRRPRSFASSMHVPDKTSVSEMTRIALLSNVLVFFSYYVQQIENNATAVPSMASLL